jgi:hypothetical protein
MAEKSRVHHGVQEAKNNTKKGPDKDTAPKNMSPVIYCLQASPTFHYLPIVSSSSESVNRLSYTRSSRRSWASS